MPAKIALPILLPNKVGLDLVPFEAESLTPAVAAQQRVTAIIQLDHIAFPMTMGAADGAAHRGAVLGKVVSP